ncbi:uncharacterized protein BDZ99DRAFT_147036 [Mytilinidion resinicola]|uniref:Uncharacterized protein n=1 Tax=Mytilinidion resinicola TaxID=574789 RepID=A0A6A6Y9L8_9PEZI|nr:uncharacterized protein BDZ99DRAFT_147036 [Mytilinidion resinicola]KAF2804517.1 hypothetical protein BDZ99DRAFT_147036 [Mytilinidion resinicola]
MRQLAAAKKATEEAKAAAKSLRQAAKAVREQAKQEDAVQLQKRKDATQGFRPTCLANYNFYREGLGYGGLPCLPLPTAASN